MQIPINWINELVKVQTIQLENLIEKLTLGGFEVEEVLELDINNKKEIVLDISATANRSDSLSIQGISSEIATLLNKPTTISEYLIKSFEWKQKLNQIAQPIANEAETTIFLAVTVDNVTNTEVPKWIKQKLISSDIVPSNNLLDFQNYVLLETGYPFCFYDYEKICLELETNEFDLSIQSAMDKQTFLAQNDKSYELNNSILTVNANKLPLSIAGVIEAKSVTYSETTKKLLIEGSNFNAAKIRQQSRNLGLRTDRSARYEKSVKNTYLIESLYRLLSLLRINNPNLICKLHTIEKVPDSVPLAILLSYETINEILGPTVESNNDNLIYITPDQITDYLTRLNFEFTYAKENSEWKVKIPDSRSDDLTREIDLIEEIGRLHGFNNFLTTLPKIKNIGNEDPYYKTRKKITTCLVNLGFNELIHYSLVNEKTFRKNEIKLINPLLADCSSLRSSLLPNLIQTVQENIKQKNLSIEGFEYGHIFTQDSSKGFKEKEYIGGILGGIKNKISWADSETQFSWFEAKGKIEQLFNQLNISVYWERSSLENQEEIFHPYRSADLYLSNNSKVGTFGQIHPILSNKLNLSSNIYLFEFDLEEITKKLQENKLMLYKEYSLYPKIIKDLSFILHQDISFKKVQEILYANGSEFLTEVNLLDEYRGQSIPDQHTSLCLQLIFHSNKKTLENKEIENIINQLQLVLTDKFNAIIRE